MLPRSRMEAASTINKSGETSRNCFKSSFVHVRAKTRRQWEYLTIQSLLSQLTLARTQTCPEQQCSTAAILEKLPPTSTGTVIQYPSTAHVPHIRYRYDSRNRAYIHVLVRPCCVCTLLSFSWLALPFVKALPLEAPLLGFDEALDGDRHRLKCRFTSVHEETNLVALFSKNR